MGKNLIKIENPFKQQQDKRKENILVFRHQ
jgi:hypothetical protein